MIDTISPHEEPDYYRPWLLTRAAAVCIVGGVLLSLCDVLLDGPEAACALFERLDVSIRDMFCNDDKTQLVSPGPEDF